MRSLTVSEIDWVSGGAEATVKVGTPAASVEVTADTKDLGDAMIEAYEGVVSFVSHVIERVAGAFG